MKELKRTMKYKLLVPAAAICMGASLSLTPVRAADTTSETSKRTVVIDNNTLNANQVLHSRVLDQSGQKLGDIEDLVLDPMTSRIQFAVVKLNSDLATDKGNYAPVPFTLLKPSATGSGDLAHRDLVLQADRSKLVSASRFNAGNWPPQDRVTWGPDVYAHYGVPWEPGIARGGTGSAIESSTGTGNEVITPTPARTETYPQTYRQEYRTYRYTTDKPIDNGTGPDGRDTFHFSPRPWPYHTTEGAH
jgi:sporulation protein YlmC with PRC-barrel domain